MRRSVHHWSIFQAGHWPKPNQPELKPAPLLRRRSRTYLAVGVRIVTSSSAAVGWTAIVGSKSALVAHLHGDADRLDDFGGSWPKMWPPTTRSLAPSTSTFIRIRSSRPDSVAFIGRNSAL